MPKVFLSLLLFTGLLLLPGCSNSEAEACAVAKKISDEYASKASEFRFEYNWRNKSKDSLSQAIAGRAYSLADEQNMYRMKQIVDNSSCFTPEQVVQAELIINENTKMCALAQDENAHYLDRARGKTDCVDL